MPGTGISKAGHYRSWYDAAKKLADPKERLAFYDALDAYRFDGVEPEGLPPLADLLWTAIKPNVDADLESRLAGASGGRGNRKDPCGAPFKESETVLMEKEKQPLEKSESMEKETEKGALNPPKGGFLDSEKGAFEKSESDVDDDVDVDVDEDVEEDADDDARATADVDSVSSWLDSHGLGMGKKESSLITASLAIRKLDTEYLDYVLEYVSAKSYRPRDGTESASFMSMPEGNRKGLFLSAVTQWKDIEQGFFRKSARASTSSPSPPERCPVCGEKVFLKGGVALCVKCNAYLDHADGKWVLSPCPDSDELLTFRKSAG